MFILSIQYNYIWTNGIKVARKLSRLLETEALTCFILLNNTSLGYRQFQMQGKRDRMILRYETNNFFYDNYRNSRAFIG